MWNKRGQVLSNRDFKQEKNITDQQLDFSENLLFGTQRQIKGEEYKHGKPAEPLHFTAS